MIAEYKCRQCGKIIEEYFATFNQVPKIKECPSCESVMEKLFSRPNVRMGGEISGYERANENDLTLGKAIDMRQKWV